MATGGRPESRPPPGPLVDRQLVPQREEFDLQRQPGAEDGGHAGDVSLPDGGGPPCMLAFATIKEGTMPQAQLATRIEAAVKRAVEEVCAARGLKINRFVEDALLDKLEELEDIEDLKKIRHEPTRRFEDVIAELKRDGKL